MMKSFFNPGTRFFALLLTILGAATGFETRLFAGQDAAAAPAQETISITIVAGQNGVNILKRQSVVIPVIEVRDSRNRPVGGALVNFTSPDDGASVTFLTGARTFSAVTEVDGRASASAALPVGAGSFQITVMAKYGDHAVATASLTQTNYATVADAENAKAAVPAQIAGTKPANSLTKDGHGLSAAAITGIVVAIAGAAAIGIVLGLRHGKSSASSTTIGIGTPTAGAPH